jgi:hypothetical protein
MHDRFLAGDKRRRSARDELLKAARERLEAERALEEAQAKLSDAERVLEEAMLVREGWIGNPGERYWGDARRYRSWHHASGFVIRLSFAFDGRVIWSFGVVPGSQASWLVAGIAYYALEEALEAWRLTSINMGRYPEAPPMSLFARLRVD